MNCPKCGSPLKFDGSGVFTCGSYAPGVGKYQSIECGLRERLAAITKERDTLQARVKRLDDALVSIQEYWNRDNNEGAMQDACWHAINTAIDALETKESNL